MKAALKTLLIIAIITAFQNLNAQDIIVLRTGEEVNAKVSEVGVNQIKYKRNDNPDGPVYTIYKNDVFMIKYPNGVKDVFTATKPGTTLNAEDAKLIEGGIGNVKKATQSDYDKYMGIYQRRRTGGIVCTAIGVPMMVLGLSFIGGGSALNQKYYEYNYYTGTYYNRTSDEGTGLIVAGSLMVAAAVPLTIIGAVKLGTSHKYLRKANEAKASLSFAPHAEAIKPVGNIGGTQLGFAMRLSF